MEIQQNQKLIHCIPQDSRVVKKGLLKFGSSVVKAAPASLFGVSLPKLLSQTVYNPLVAAGGICSGMVTATIASSFAMPCTPSKANTFYQRVFTNLKSSAGNILKSSVVAGTCGLFGELTASALDQSTLVNGTSEMPLTDDSDLTSKFSILAASIFGGFAVELGLKGAASIASKAISACRGVSFSIKGFSLSKAAILGSMFDIFLLSGIADSSLLFTSLDTIPMALVHLAITASAIGLKQAGQDQIFKSYQKELSKSFEAMLEDDSITDKTRILELKLHSEKDDLNKEIFVEIIKELNQIYKESQARSPSDQPPNRSPYITPTGSMRISPKHNKSDHVSIDLEFEPVEEDYLPVKPLPAYSLNHEVKESSTEDPADRAS